MNKNELKYYGALATVGSGIIGTILGIGFFCGSFTTVHQNTVAIYRNISTGEIVVDDSAGLKMKNPMLKKASEMQTTMAEVQFGNDDPTHGLGGYVPFNDKDGNEFNASLNVKWKPLVDEKHSATQDALELYKNFGDAAIDSARIISIIQTAAKDGMQSWIDGQKTLSATQVPSKKSELTIYIKAKIAEAIKPYNLNLVQANIGDIVAPERVKKQIDQATQSATQQQIAHNEQIAAAAQVEAAKAKQAVREQEALNELIGDKLIKAALLSAGIDTSDLTSTHDLIDRIKLFNDAHPDHLLDLAELIKTSLYFGKWNGVLPTTLAGSGIQTLLPLG